MLGRAFTLAYRSAHLPHRPYLPSPRVNNARTGFFTDGEVKALLVQLPEYMQPFVEAAYINGWRRGELRNLLPRSPNAFRIIQTSTPNTITPDTIST